MKGNDYVYTISKTQDSSGNELITITAKLDWVSNSEGRSTRGTQVRTVTIKKLDTNTSQRVCTFDDAPVQLESYGV